MPSSTQSAAPRREFVSLAAGFSSDGKLRHIWSARTVIVLLAVSCIMTAPTLVAAEVAVFDERLELNEFAAAPQIRQPVSMVYDNAGRLLVIENHSHFRPDNYDGPEFDRIRVVEDQDGDGRADNISTYFEQERDSMDLARAGNGTIYLATRRRILRLNDTDQDGVAESSTAIVQLQTDGNYPHNGLSGLAFDSQDDLHFGFGENLGADYTLTGSDGSQHRGGGEGGSVFVCGPDGSQLRQVATGFWNPFGQCFDALGNLFAVDNDPDSSPPCRLLHVIEGGNYGYQFRYGRSGKHPLQAWNGELPGTLPMVAGTGEAPCEIIAYTGSGLPTDYRGDLLVASWGDHRIERYRLVSHGVSFRAERTIVLQGDANFWPVGIAVAPDGTLMISDWGSRSYPLHNQGKIWHLRAKTIGADVAAENVGTDVGNANVTPVAGDTSSAIQQLRDVVQLQSTTDRKQLLANGSCWQFDINDPFVQASCVDIIAGSEMLRDDLFAAAELNERQRVVRALVFEAANDIRLPMVFASWLRQGNASERIVLSRWAADHRQSSLRPALRAALALSENSPRATLAVLASLAELDGEKFDGQAAQQRMAQLIFDSSLAEPVRVAVLQAADPARLDRQQLLALAKPDDRSNDTNPALAAAALRAVALTHNADSASDDAGKIENDGRNSDDDVRDLLMSVALDTQRTLAERADAIMGLSRFAMQVSGALIDLAVSPKSIAGLAAEEQREQQRVLREEALRSLVGIPLEAAQQRRLQAAVTGPTVNRLLAPNTTILTEAIDPQALATELAGLPSSADVAAGRRIFHRHSLVQCANCHAVQNRGAVVGPDLTGLGKSHSNEQILTSIMQPSREIAPQYQPWVVVTNDGRTQVGFHVHSQSLVEIFADAEGREFRVAQDDILERHPSDKSIMPEGTWQRLTREELRDLLAFLRE